MPMRMALDKLLEALVSSIVLKATATALAATCVVGVSMVLEMVVGGAQRGFDGYSRSGGQLIGGSLATAPTWKRGAKWKLRLKQPIVPQITIMISPRPSFMSCWTES